MTKARVDHYTSVAIVLHWLIAALVVGLIIAGLSMTKIDALPRALRFEMIQMHKSIGLTVLALTLARVIWRLSHRPPPLPVAMPAWQKTVSTLTHGAFYVLLLALPVSGYLMVSASAWGVPTFYFGVIEVPHFPGFAELTPEAKKPIEGLFKETHEILAFGAIALVVLHVGAALRHHFVDKDAVLTRMAPWLRAR